MYSFKTATLPISSFAVGALLCSITACAYTPPPDPTTGDFIVPEIAMPNLPAKAVKTDDIVHATKNDTWASKPSRVGPRTLATRLQVTSSETTARDDSLRVTLKFTDQPIQTVADTILGEMLGVSYSVSPGVKGMVNFSTSTSVNRDELLTILQNLLSWTDNALIATDRGYLVTPLSGAIAGNLSPSYSLEKPPAGLAARLFTLKYISASEIQKLIKPFAKPNALLLVDQSRNIIGLAGTPQELASYESTIDSFDTNWLAGMSFGVYGLRNVSAGKLITSLKSVFSSTVGNGAPAPVQFIELEVANSVVAITHQPEYLDELASWIEQFDNSGSEPQLYTYGVKNLSAGDLAKLLNKIYGDEAPSTSAFNVAPELHSTTYAASHTSDSNTMMKTLPTDTLSAIGQDSSTSDSADAVERVGSSQDVDSSSPDVDIRTNIRIAAQSASNQLLIRARPDQWNEIESTIKKLDIAPAQVQIQTRILEVNLTNGLDLGVQWYLGKLSEGSDGASMSGHGVSIGNAGTALTSSDSLFYSFISNKLQFAIHALETQGRTQVLSAPSMIVLNNQKAKIQVGNNVPVNQTTINTGNSDTTLSSVQYIQTGVILDVIPRISPDGLVYLDIQQQVSNANSADSSKNPVISTRSMSTRVAVQSGQTVLLGGLISHDGGSAKSKVPYLSDIPGLRWLFGSSSNSASRTELIALITPNIINDQGQAVDITHQYRDQLQLIRPRY